MKKYLVAVTILALAAVLAAGCGGAPSETPTLTPTPSPTEEGNFRFLISDDVNAIEDFEHLYVTISSIGVHQGGESGSWHLFDPYSDPDGDGIDGVDLRPLVGANAQEIWSGDIPTGEYTKVFIYVSDVWGILVDAEEGETVDVMLPSEKLQISKPFEVTEDSVTSFVYDITVVAAGNEQSGIKYILKPQIVHSGADQEFEEVTAQETPGEPGLQLQLEGDPGLGAEVSLIVTAEGSPIEGAMVTVNGEEVGSSGADGRLTIVFPDTPGEAEIQATFEDKSGELELELGEQEEQLEWFEGTITAISQGEENASPWTMTLEGVEGLVTVYVVELEGTPSVGAKAKVEGVLKNDSIEEGKAEIEEEE